MVLVMKVILELKFHYIRLTKSSSLLSVGTYMMAACLRKILPTFKRSVLCVICQISLTLPDTW